MDSWTKKACLFRSAEHCTLKKVVVEIKALGTIHRGNRRTKRQGNAKRKVFVIIYRSKNRAHYAFRQRGYCSASFGNQIIQHVPWKTSDHEIAAKKETICAFLG